MSTDDKKSLSEHLKEAYLNHLACAKEDYPEDNFEDIAVEHTAESVRGMIARIADSHHWEGVDAVNKFHFD